MLTSMNVLSGCIGCVMAFEGNYFLVVIWIAIAAICDFFDGFSARLLNVHSPIGKDLDSLADVISFGLAPSILVFRYISDSPTINSIDSPIANYIPYISFSLAIFSAIRLANFNVDTRQTTSFIGLNTPSNALFWISLCYGLSLNKLPIEESISIWIILILVFIFSFLLIAEIPMFSLKTKNYKFKGNEARYITLLFVVTAVSLWGIIGISAGIMLYIFLSLFSYIRQN